MQFPPVAKGSSGRTRIFAPSLGCYEASLIGLHEGAMAVVDLAEAGVLRQAVVLYPFEVALPYIGEMRRDQGVFSALF